MTVNLGLFKIRDQFICTSLWESFAHLCDQIKETSEEMYEKAKEDVMEQINQMVCEIDFNATVDHEFDYHYVPSQDIKTAFVNIGSDWLERNWWLRYLEYIFDIRILLLIVFSLWIFIKYI